MRGIMFMELLFGRTIEGFKDMTRRSGGLDKVNGTKENPLDPDDVIIHSMDEWYDSKGTLWQQFGHKEGPNIDCYSFYKKGEYLYIKEPTAKLDNGEILYKYQPSKSVSTVWDNKMFMGADRARYYIQITGIKVERFNDITTEDCIREGVPKLSWDRKTNNARRFKRISEREQFFSIYRLANNIPASKELRNIWVFAYTYRLITDPKEIERIRENGK